MSEETQLAVRDETGLSARGVELRSLDELANFAQIVVRSRLAPKGFETPEAVLVAIQHGMEIGLSPMQALQSIAVIGNRPCVWGDAALALVTARQDCEDVIETFEREGEDGGAAICEIHRTGRTPIIRRFSVAMAKKAGLWGKGGPWTQYPQRMLQMRARSWALRDAFPDALRGVGIAEEVRDIEPRQATGRTIEKPKLVLPDEEPEQQEPEPVAATTEQRDEEGNFTF